jgi:hypothetical protein
LTLLPVNKVTKKFYNIHHRNSFGVVGATLTVVVDNRVGAALLSLVLVVEVVQVAGRRAPVQFVHHQSLPMTKAAVDSLKNIATCGQMFKTFYGRKLRLFISLSLASLSSQSNVCR